MTFHRLRINGICIWISAIYLNNLADILKPTSAVCLNTTIHEQAVFLLVTPRL